jgi:anti-sigma factor RsiW
MSVSPDDLMRYHDGDLPPERAREVERAIEHDEAARERLAALRQLGALTRLWAEERSAAGGDIARGVMDRIAREDRAAEVARRRVLHRAVPAGASLLAAAAVALFVAFDRPRAHTDSVQTLASSQARGPVATESAAPRVAELPPAAVAGPAVAIEAVDFGESHGSIFVVSSERGDVPVVWLSDGPAIKAPRTHPL